MMAKIQAAWAAYQTARAAARATRRGIREARKAKREWSRHRRWARWAARWLPVLLIACAGCETLRRGRDWLDGKIRPGTPESGDAFPAGTRWLHADASGWAQTATLTASVSGSTIHLRYDKARAWPVLRQRAQDGGPLVGNCWALIQRDEQWYAVAWDWMRQGQQSKGVGSFRGSGGHMPVPLSDFRPVRGARYGFFVTTAARGQERSGNERSNVSWVDWP